MNPNLKIFFKRSIYVIAIMVLSAGAYFSVTRFISIDFSAIGEYIMYGFVGLMMITMVVFIAGLILRTAWTGIMNRVDTIIMCCPDKQNDGMHIVASHYNPGGESSEGFDNYFHYYLDQRGKLFLSKKVEQEGREIGKSILHLSEQTRLQLDPDRERSVRVGSYSDKERVNGTTVKTRNGELHFKGYEGLIDYGFKVTFSKKGKVKWRVRI